MIEGLIKKDVCFQLDFCFHCSFWQSCAHPCSHVFVSFLLGRSPMLQKQIGWLRTIARLTAGTQRHGLDGPGRTCGPSPSHGVSQPIDVLIICCGFMVRFGNSSKRFWSPKELQGPTECWKQPRARTRSPVLGLSWARCASRPLLYRSALFTFACCPALLVHSMSHFLLRKPWASVVS